MGATLLKSAELRQSKNSAREWRMRLTVTKQRCYTLDGRWGFIFHPVTDRLLFIFIIPIIEVDLFTPAMEFQLTNPDSPSFPSSLLEQNKAVSSTFGLLFQRKLILHGHGDCQSSELKSLLANFHHNWWKSKSLKAIRAPMCFLQSMTQKERKALLLPSWSKNTKE